MSQAPEYSRTKSFLDDASDRTDHASLNAELDRIATSIKGLRDNAALLQADDGALKSKVVTVASLTQEVIDLMTGTSVLTIKGDPGDVGSSFNADYQGTELERPTFAARPKGFSFLAMDSGKLYFKLSDTSGHWSTGYTYGKGETGDSAYKTWLSLGNACTEAQFIATLKGTKGDNGTSGLVTAVDDTVKTVTLTGRSSLSFRLSMVGGQLQIVASTS